MKNTIGISLETFGAYDWVNCISDKDLKQFQLFEINRNANLLPLKKNLDYEKSIISSGNFSMHSGSSFHFVGDHIFNQTARDIFLSEIELCKLLGIDKLVFHIRDNYSEEFQSFIDLADKKAQTYHIDLILENNKSGEFSKLENLLAATKNTNFKINIDLGHLKIATGGDIDQAKKYIQELKDRIVYVHLHTNNGKKDEHKLIDTDDQFVKEIIVEIEKQVKNDISWVIENNNKNEALESLEYFKTINI